MKSGLHALTLIVFILAAFVCARGGEISLYVNGETIFFSHAIIQRDGEMLVPLRELGLPLGVETESIEEEDSIVIRSASGDHFFSTDHFPTYNGIYYVSLGELVSLAGARMHTLGDEIYIESDAPHLYGIDAADDEVSVRFDGFVPYRILPSDENTLHVRFYHCALTTDPRQVAIDSGVITSVALTLSGHRSADLVIVLSSKPLAATKRFITDGFYSLSFSFGGQQSTETEETISDHITYHEITTDIGDGPVRVMYLKIDEWRDHYRLVPATSEGGIGTLASLKDIARSHNADAAINANSFYTKTNIPLGLLIIDGKALSTSCGRRAALGIDLFGRLTFFNPQASLFLRAGDTKITIDDVNEPIEAGQVVMYTSGYSGPLTQGFVDSFRAVKIKEGRVTSVQDGPYVITDQTADLLIACGSAIGRLSSLSVGDEVSYEYLLDQGDDLIKDAVSAGHLLYLNGKNVLDDNSAEDVRLARSLLATDWYGSLILMTVAKNEGSVGTDLSGLIELLGQIPIMVKSAIAFDGGSASSLVFKDGAIYREVSSGEKVAVGLLLVSTDR